MVSFLFFVIFISAMLWILMSKVFRRITRIGDRMEHIWDDMSVAETGKKRDEVGRLESRYNDLVLQLNQAIDDIASEKTQKQVFELV